MEGAAILWHAPLGYLLAGNSVGVCAAPGTVNSHPVLHFMPAKAEATGKVLPEENMLLLGAEFRGIGCTINGTWII